MAQIAFPVISAFSENCLNATKPEDITEPFGALLRHEGINSYFVGSLANVSEGGRGFGFYGIPKVWHERYIGEGYHACDPVFQHALSGRSRVTWSQCRRRAIKSGAGKRALNVFDEAAEVGLTDGFIMPVHGFGDLPGCVTYGGEDLDLSEEMQMSLFMVGAFAFEGLRRLIEKFRPIPPYFTPQELKILRWSAQGKSATDIAAILKRSAHTVRTHHINIKQKYDVNTMMQACVMAALDGTLAVAAQF